MTHEPECFMSTSETSHICICTVLRAAYQRGIEGAQEWAKQEYRQGLADGYRDGEKAGYTAGYNDHARSRAHAEQMYGTYPRRVKGLADLADERTVEHWNQHGEGTNP